MLVIEIMFTDLGENGEFFDSVTGNIVREFREQKKQTILFNLMSEGLMYNELVKIDKLANFLIKEKDFKIDEFLILSGGLPLIENYHHYISACERFNWIELPIQFVNWWEITRKYQSTADHNAYDQIDTTPRIKNKKFVCYNRSVKPHRMFITAEIISRGLLDKCYLSNYFDYNNDQYNLNNLHAYFPNAAERVVQVVHANKNLFPIDLGLLDLQHDNEKLANRTHGLFPEDVEHFNNSYFALITESKFFQDSPSDLSLLATDLSLNCFFLTEKTFKIIHGRFPFVLAGFAGSLKMLRKLGYKTFHPYIDESYDAIENDEERLEAIMDEVERLSHLPDGDLLDWQESIQPILEHNYQVLLSSDTRCFTANAHC